MPVDVRRIQRHKQWGDKESPLLYYLIQGARTSKTSNIGDIAKDIEEVGALSTDDVIHTMNSFIKRLRKVLLKGERVKVDGLGIFYMTFCCKGAETEKDCTVKCIHSVKIRFLPDKSLKLVNDSLATTRSADNNVMFQVVGKKSGGVEGETGGAGGNDDGDGDEFVDPIV